MRAVLVLVVPVLAACAAASVPAPRATATRVPISNDLRAGDERIDGSFLAPYEARWSIGVALADGRRRDDATWTDRLEAVTVDGRRALKRTQHESESLADEEVHPGLAKKLGVPSLEVTYVNVFDPATLAPITTRIESNLGRTMDLRFDGARVTGAKSGWTPAPLAIDDRLDAAPFDFHGGTYGLILASLDAPDDLRGRLAAYALPRGTASAGALQWLDLRAVGGERIVAGSFGARDARVFEIADGGGGTFRFWIARQPPYVLRVVLAIPEEKQTWSYDLL